MNTSTGPYHVVELPVGRRIWLNALNLSGPTHWMYGLLEVDVTIAQQLITEHKSRTGETLSFTGFLVYCLARAVDENKEVQAYLKGRTKIVTFDDVNVGLMIEHKAGEKTAPVPANRGMPSWFRSALLLPWPLSRLVNILMSIATRRDPTIRVAASGTVAVTAVGMFGKGHSGWGIATTPVSLSLVVGSMAWKPAVVDGRIEPREILNLTVLFDHEVVDGAPATRFVRRLVELIESGYGLKDAIAG
jgi:pyruvate/2-oxoglutarate dehydrogenase complex dihydrolipoamide acyltransferase (E2) component